MKYCHSLQSSSSKGFSLLELLVVLILLSILVTLGARSFNDAWRREKVNSAAIELAGWLEAVRRQAIRGQSCVVSVAAGELSGGQNLATATSIAPTVASTAIANQCLPNSLPARVPALPGNSTVQVAATNSEDEPITGFTYTPRGTVFVDGESDPTITIAITLNPNPPGPTRCVQLDGLLGFVRIGQDDNGVCGGRF